MEMVSGASARIKANLIAGWRWREAAIKMLESLRCASPARRPA